MMYRQEDGHCSTACAIGVGIRSSMLQKVPRAAGKVRHRDARRMAFHWYLHHCQSNRGVYLIRPTLWQRTRTIVFEVRIVAAVSLILFL